jgi:inosose dehydratase
MNSHSTRRTFLAGLGAVAAVTTLPSFAEAGRTRDIRFGYTAMTWGNEERQAIEDIAAVGFPGIQFRANAVAEFKPTVLKELLAQHKLTFVALSSGEVSLDDREKPFDPAFLVLLNREIKNLGGELPLRKIYFQ